MRKVCGLHLVRTSPRWELKIRIIILMYWRWNSLTQYKMWWTISMSLGKVVSWDVSFQPVRDSPRKFRHRLLSWGNLQLGLTTFDWYHTIYQWDQYICVNIQLIVKELSPHLTGEDNPPTSTSKVASSRSLLQDCRYVADVIDHTLTPLTSTDNLLHLFFFCL